MLIRILFLLFSLFYCLSYSSAQEKRLKYLGFEAGMNFIESEIKDMDNIRGSIPLYFNGYTTYSVTSFTYRSYIGAKAEIFSISDRIGLQAGIRFIKVNSSIGKNDYFSDNTNYFYWLHREEGTLTSYLKVKEIDQKSSYLGIPVEIRYFTERRPRIFQIYLKLGTEISYLLSSKIDVDFKNPEMNQYRNDVVGKLDKPDIFNAVVYTGAGVRFGRDQKPTLSIEASLPFIYLNPQSNGITKPIIGGGFQVNFQVPIKSKT